MKFLEFLDKVSELVFPSDFKCLSCEKDIQKGEAFCTRCKQELPYNSGNVCEVCGINIPSAGRCVRCNGKKVYEMARAPFLYDGAIKKIIHNFKYNNAKYLFKPMAKYMTDCYNKFNMQADVIVPIPLFKKRLKERGYNQAFKLGEEIGKVLNLPIINGLERIKDTPTQTTLDFKDRKNNVKGAFKALDKTFKGKNVLLIDDVYTSGATLKEACKVLKSSGANKIYVLTLAHTMLENKKDSKSFK